MIYVHKAVTPEEIKERGFEDIGELPFNWAFDKYGYYFESDGNVIQWADSSYKVDLRRPLNIININRFDELLRALTHTD